MNFGQAFTYPFEDPDWVKKLLIPALIAIIPVVGQVFLVGWSLDVARRVIQQNPHPLPDIDFGRQLVDGLKAFVVSLVYSIPVIIFTIPIIVVSAIFQGNANVDSNVAGTLFSLVSICCGGLIFLYSVLLAFVLPAALGNFAAHGTISAGLRFNEVISLLRAAPGAYLLTLVGVIIAGFISGLGAIACVIGAFATLAYAQSIMGHLYGQAYNEAIRNRSFAQAL